MSKTKSKPETAPQEESTTESVVGVAHPRLIRQSLTLDEFVSGQLKSLEDFESSWRELHRKNDEIYPLEMFAGDWSEQLAFWRESEDLILHNATVEARR